MPQYPSNLIAQNPTNALVPLKADAIGNLLTGSGLSSKLNVTAAGVVKVGAGRVAKIINNAGVAGFTINDCATTGAAAAANAIMVVTTTTVGQVIALDFPFTTGLVVSAVGASGVLAISFT